MKPYEIFEKVTKELHSYISPKSLVRHNQKIIGKSGVERQIDILIEDEVASYKITILVDCKYYSSKVDINDVEEVWGKVDDIRANLGVIISNAGFTEGAIKRANELGRLKLCSILDLENKDFSVKLSLPVINEYHRPLLSIQIGGTASNFSLKGYPKEWLIENKKNGKRITIYHAFMSMWNDDKVSDEVGDHETAFSPDEWWFINADNEKVDFTVLKVNYEVVPRYYYGLVPLIEGKGIMDIQNNVLKTKSFKTDKISIEDVEKNWEKFDRLEDIKIKPVFHLVAKDIFSFTDKS